MSRDGPATLLTAHSQTVPSLSASRYQPYSTSPVWYGPYPFAFASLQVPKRGSVAGAAAIGCGGSGAAVGGGAGAAVGAGTGAAIGWGAGATVGGTVTGSGAGVGGTVAAMVVGAAATVVTAAVVVGSAVVLGSTTAVVTAADVAVAARLAPLVESSFGIHPASTTTAPIGTPIFAQSGHAV